MGKQIRHTYPMAPVTDVPDIQVCRHSWIYFRVADHRLEDWLKEQRKQRRQRKEKVNSQ